MTQAEQCETIRAVAGSVLAEELDYWLHGIERDPADYPDGYDEVDALMDVAASDIGQEPAMRRAIRRVETALGWWRPVRPGEEVHEMVRGRSRVLAAGDLVYCGPGAE
jgi:hypothetical protein